MNLVLLGRKRIKRLTVLSLLAIVVILLFIMPHLGASIAVPEVIQPTEPDYWPGLEKYGVPKNVLTELVVNTAIQAAKTKNIEPADMLAIYIKESGLWLFSGDGGCSVGPAHINWCVRKKTLTKAQAIDPVFTANWVADNLIANGYKAGDRMSALGKHQGGSKANKIYAYEAADFAEKLKANSK